MGEACTIVLRGATSHLLDETERSLHDALCVLSQVCPLLPLYINGAYCENRWYPNQEQYLEEVVQR